MPLEFPPLVSERSAQSLQQLLGFLVGLSGGNEADVHAADRVNLVEVDLGEDDLFLQAEGVVAAAVEGVAVDTCLLYTSPSPRDRTRSRMPSSA